MTRTLISTFTLLAWLLITPLAQAEKLKTYSNIVTNPASDRSYILTADVEILWAFDQLDEAEVAATREAILIAMKQLDAKSISFPNGAQLLKTEIAARLKEAPLLTGEAKHIFITRLVLENSARYRR